MYHRIHASLASHLRQVASMPGLAFSQVLTPAMVNQVLQDWPIAFRDRVYNPALTLWAFLWQTLDANHACSGAVARVLAWRVAQGYGPCSANTGSYCQARSRLPLKVLENLLHQLGQGMHAQAPESWRWKGRCVKIVDGTTVSMPDTPENQQRFPQPSAQKPGLGFPIARLVVVFSLSCGAALDLAIGPYQGKMTGENTMFRRLMRRINPNDVVLADRFYSSYCDLAMLAQHGADVLVRKHQLRKTDLREAQRLGPEDHRVVWHRPAQCPKGIARQTFDQLPATLNLRQVTIHVPFKGFRTQKLTLVTTLLDAKAYPKADLGKLYRQRWDAELDLRSLKTTLGMDVLRCRTPEMVEKEIWAHLLAYNAVRLLMAQAAQAHARRPARLSFSGALQLLRAFHDAGLLAYPLAHDALLRAIAQRTVPDRPGRVEPRAIKRRPKPHRILNIPRSQARQQLLR